MAGLQIALTHAHTHTHKHIHRDKQADLIPGVDQFNNEMTVYEMNELYMFAITFISKSFRNLSPVLESLKFNSNKP